MYLLNTVTLGPFEYIILGVSGFLLLGLLGAVLLVFSIVGALMGAVKGFLTEHNTNNPTNPYGRDEKNGMFAGVLAGGAKISGIPVDLLRIGFVVAMLATGILPLVIIYTLLAFTLPDNK